MSNDNTDEVLEIGTNANCNGNTNNSTFKEAVFFRRITHSRTLRFSKILFDISPDLDTEMRSKIQEYKSGPSYAETYSPHAFSPLELHQKRPISLSYQSYQKLSNIIATS
jgi:hypothetical protein